MQPKNPLHGITLQAILESLVEDVGFEELGQQINIKCFQVNPSIKSSLTFLRKTPWAREKVENYYLYRQRQKNKAKKTIQKVETSQPQIQ